MASSIPSGEFLSSAGAGGAGPSSSPRPMYGPHPQDHGFGSIQSGEEKAQKSCKL